MVSEEQLKEEINLLFEDNLSSLEGINFFINLKELASKGYDEKKVRKVLRDGFNSYIDDYGVLRPLIKGGS